MLFLTLFVTSMTEYQYSTIFERGRSEVDLATLLGRLYGACHAFNILVCLFVFSPLVRRFGVRNLALLLPTIYLVASILLFLQSSVVTAAIAFWSYHSVLTSIEYNNQNLLFNALPARTRRGLRTLIEGFCEPFASCLSGLFLLLVQETWGLRQIAGITALISALLIGAALGVRGAYPAAMSGNMRLGWLNLVGSRRMRIAPEDAESIELLEQAAGAPTITGIEAMTMLIDASPARAAPLVLRAISEWPDALSGPLDAALQHLLARCSESVYAEVIADLMRAASAGNRLANAQLTRLALPVVGEGISGDSEDHLSRLRSRSPATRGAALAGLDSMLRGDAAARTNAARLLAQLRDPAFTACLLGLLTDAAQGVRPAALAALVHVARANDSVVAAAIIGAVPLLSGDERELAFDVLDVCADAEQVNDLIAIAPLLGPGELRDLQDIITTRGRLALPALVVAVSDDQLAYPHRRLAARALSQISPKHLENLQAQLVSAQIEYIEAIQRRALILAPAPRECRLLIAYYRDQSQASLEFALELLALIGVLPDYDLVAASLQSSNAKVRANALETIETSLDHTLFGRLAGVISHRGSPLHDGAAARVSAAMLSVVEDALLTGDELEAGLAADALGRLGAARLDPLVRQRLMRGDAALVREAAAAHRDGAAPTVFGSLGAASLAPELAHTPLASVLAVLRMTGPAGCAPASLDGRIAALAPTSADLAMSLLRSRLTA